LKLTKDDVRYVADLARLEFDEKETDSLVGQLQKILEYEQELNELDTTGVEPTAHAFSLNNVLREDVVKESLDREEALSNAPEKDQGCFKVPKVLE